MAQIGFPIPQKENERRRALLPIHLADVASARELVFETGYGRAVGIGDDDYRQCGVTVADRTTVCECPIICCAKPALEDEYYRCGKTLFGWIHAVQGRAITDKLVGARMTAIAWEDMSDGGRHLYWRNNELSGEAAVMHAFILWGRMPYECVVAVIGRGNVARGAIRTLERLGCRVTIYDRKTVSLLPREIGQYDVIVNAVLWDVFRTDHLVSEGDLAKMKPGSMIIDISCDEHMGIESSRATTIEDPIYTYNGVVHYVVDHTPSLLHVAASNSISAVVSCFIDDLASGRENPTLERATIIRDGQILDDRIKRFQCRD